LHGGAAFQAVEFAATSIERPGKAHFVLITDLYEGGNAEEVLTRLARLIDLGVNVIVLLALSDAGRPAYNPNLSARVAALGAPVFACTPDQFPTSWPPPCAARICTPARPSRTSNWSARRNEPVEGWFPSVHSKHLPDDSTRVTVSAS
jgi:VWA domain containing CoxE-like protein